MEEIRVMVADATHEKYVDTILQTIAEAAKVRGTGIAKRSPEYVATKMREAKAVIALSGEKFAGFSYIETWGNKTYVTTSGLIVHPDFRGMGVAKRIKDMTFSLARTRWPHAKIFSLTSGAAVMTMNSQLGYQPVTFADLTDDEAFWRGCEGCINVDVLHRTGRKYCICTAMLYDPEEHLPAKIPQEVIDRIRELEAPLPPGGGCLNDGSETMGVCRKTLCQSAEGSVYGELKGSAKDGSEPMGVCRKALYQSAEGSVYGELKEFAKENRKHPTQAESVLWEILRGKSLGCSFRRQHVIGPFIVDFVCLDKSLVIEIDGGYHQLPEQQTSDEERTKWLNGHGLKVIRFTNEEILTNTEQVINNIKHVLSQCG